MQNVVSNFKINLPIKYSNKWKYHIMTAAITNSYFKFNVNIFSKISIDLKTFCFSRFSNFNLTFQSDSNQDEIVFNLFAIDLYYLKWT